MNKKEMKKVMTIDGEDVYMPRDVYNMEVKRMRKLREEIEQTLNEEQENLEIYMEKPNHINDNLIGWIEALEYVLGQIDAIGGEEE